MSDGTWRVESVNFEEYAQELVAAMREQGEDPRRIALGQIKTGRIMLEILEAENE